MRLGDLDALKENLFIKFGNQLPNGLLEEIDNAPTVEGEISIMTEEAYLRLQASKERPQGKWVNTSPYDTDGECSYCCYVSEKYYNFCPNCGVSMQKGGAE